MVRNNQRLPENKQINFETLCYKGNNLLILAT